MDIWMVPMILLLIIAYVSPRTREGPRLPAPWRLHGQLSGFEWLAFLAQVLAASLFSFGGKMS